MAVGAARGALLRTIATGQPITKWLLNETTGTNAADTGNTSYPGTCQNGLNFDDDAVAGGGLSFDGSNYILMGDIPILVGATSCKITFSAALPVSSPPNSTTSTVCRQWNSGAQKVGVWLSVAGSGVVTMEFRFANADNSEQVVSNTTTGLIGVIMADFEITWSGDTVTFKKDNVAQTIAYTRRDFVSSLGKVGAEGFTIGAKYQNGSPTEYFTGDIKDMIIEDTSA